MLHEGVEFIGGDLQLFEEELGRAESTFMRLGGALLSNFWTWRRIDDGYLGQVSMCLRMRS